MSRSKSVQIAIISVGFVLLWVADLSVAGPKIHPGEWKFTMKTKIEGLGIPLPAIPTSFENCVTKTDASPIETPEMKKAGCKIINAKIKGHTITYTGHCVQKDTIVDTHIKATYKVDSMAGSLKQVATASGKVLHTATGTITGTRIGSCKAK